MWVCACVPVYVCVITLSSFSDQYEQGLHQQQAATSCVSKTKNFFRKLRQIYHFRELETHCDPLRDPTWHVRTNFYELRFVINFVQQQQNKSQQPRHHTSTSDNDISTSTSPTATRRQPIRSSAPARSLYPDAFVFL